MPGASRFHFFGGKGGVGKTTCSSAAAVAAAERGGRVLLVSLDPAHSLGNVLGRKVGPRKKRVPVRRGTLHALELDADAALERWLDERRETLETIAERGTYLDAEDVKRFLRLSFPGVDELVGLLELARVAREGEHDEVVVDTAPTGHTLRLLAMPETLRKLATVLDDMQEKHRVVAASLGGRLRRDASEALIEEIDQEGEALAALLRDPERVRFTWVLLPERLSVEEAHDGLAALERERIAVSEVLVNRVTRAPRSRCPLCTGRVAAEADALATLRVKPRVRHIGAAEEEPRGVAALRAFSKLGVAPAAKRAPATERTERTERSRAKALSPFLRALRELCGKESGGVRLLLFGGKGGTGKTTCAAATALALARDEPGRRILLLSADPAHSLGDVLGKKLGDEPVRLARNLVARELDAALVFERTRERFKEAVDDLFSALRGESAFAETYDRAVARDLIELAPPGIDELFALLSFLDELAPESGEARHDLVVVDTAPSGHALRLLELPASAQEWVKAILQVILKYRELTGLGRLTEDLVALSRGLRKLRALLADGKRTLFVPVARPAALPRLETARLLRRLDALGIAAPLVVANAVTPAGCARCERARRRERRELAALSRSARRVILVARAVAPPPRGAGALEEWGRSWQPL